MDGYALRAEECSAKADSPGATEVARQGRRWRKLFGASFRQVIVSGFSPARLCLAEQTAVSYKRIQRRLR